MKPKIKNKFRIHDFTRLTEIINRVQTGSDPWRKHLTPPNTSSVSFLRPQSQQYEPPLLEHRTDNGTSQQKKKYLYPLLIEPYCFYRILFSTRQFQHHNVLLTISNQPFLCFFNFIISKKPIGDAIGNIGNNKTVDLLVWDYYAFSTTAFCDHYGTA